MENKKSTKKEIKNSKKISNAEKRAVKKHIKHEKRMSKKELNGYKRRNFIIESIILFIFLIIIFMVLSNKTFLKNKYTNELSGSNIDIDIPRFTYFVSDKTKDGVEHTVTFKTLKKTSNVKKYFDEFFDNTDKYDLYFCDEDSVYYYNSTGNYFIKEVNISKNFAIKTIKITYSVEDENTFCLNQK